MNCACVTAVSRFGLNAFYSHHKLGKSPSYIVAAFDKLTLMNCKYLKLPCFNASRCV